MGFANWNQFGCNYTDALFREMADTFVSTGLAAKGYEFMLVQECIVPKGARDPVTGVVQPNTAMFPHGLADLADYFHAKGLKAGVYTDVKSLTCADFEGSGPGPGVPSHWALDALTYAQWGFDMIEADFCNPSGRTGANGSAYELYKEARDAIAAATAATGRIITFYACNWGEEAPWTWGPEVANLFRNTGDICAPGSIAFHRILSNFDNTIVHSSTPPSRPGVPGTGIGAWNDPDMLGVGMPGITDTEGRTQFSLWCVLGAPLFLGTDVRSASAFTMATIGNVEAIAIDQDPLGIQGFALSPAAAPTPFAGGLLLNLSACPAAAAAGGTGARWRLTAGGQLQSADNTTCVTVLACGTAPASLVFGYSCVTDACGNQLWQWRGPAAGGQVVSREAGAGGMCLAAVPSPQAAGGLLSLQPCQPGAPAQTWALDAGGGGALSLPLLDPAAPQCVFYPGAPPLGAYAKPLTPIAGVGQPYALALLNRGEEGVAGQQVDLASLGFAPAQRVTVRDIWADTTSAPLSGAFTTRPVASHETLLLRITPVP